VVNHLTLDSVATALMQTLDTARVQQCNQTDAADFGGRVQPQSHVADHRGTAELIHGLSLQWRLQVKHPGLVPAAPVATLETALSRALEYLLRIQRPSGLFDTIDCNYDSPPDTGFSVQHLAAAWANFSVVGAPAQRVQTALSKVLKRTIPGLATCGFHTPNHRWVVLSALVLVNQIFPQLDLSAPMRRLQAEGVDVDADGLFIERSPAVYDTVNLFSLLLTHEQRPWPEALRGVLACLQFNQHLFHADYTVETGLSHRYDFGQSLVPQGLIYCYYRAGKVSGDRHWLKVADEIWQHSPRDMFNALCHLLQAVLDLGATDPASLADLPGLPTEYNDWYPTNKFWRRRAGLLSASVFGGTRRLLSMKFGAAHLHCVSVHQSYFGPAGEFVGDTFTLTPQGITLHSRGVRHPRRPGYDLPLERRIADIHEWMQTEDGRTQHRLPFAEVDLQLENLPDGLAGTLTTRGGTEGVMAQIALDFAPGGVWSTADTALQPVANQVLMLHGAAGTMRYGNDAITITGGSPTHSTWAMRDSLQLAGTARVIIPLRTPFTHRFTLRGHRGW